MSSIIFSNQQQSTFVIIVKIPTSPESSPRIYISVRDVSTIYLIAYSNIAQLTRCLQLMGYLLISTTMAAVVTANGPPSDLERGQGGLKITRKARYVRDITYKIMPSCFVGLVLFSAGGILTATLSYNQPIPRGPVIVISAMLLAFLVIFCLGGAYLYWRKRFPPLTKGPNAPDRPAPVTKTWKDRVRRCCEVIIEKLSDNNVANEPEANPAPPSTPLPPPPGTSNNPAELPRFNDQGTPSQEGIEQPYNAQSPNTAGHQNAVYGQGDNRPMTQRTNWPTRRHLVSSNSNSNSPELNHIMRSGLQSNYPHTPNPHITLQDPRNIERGQGHRSQISAYSPSSQADGRSTHGHAEATSPTRPKPNGPRHQRSPSRPGAPESLRTGHTRINLAYIPNSTNHRAFAQVLPEEFSQGGLYILDKLLTSAAHDLTATKPAERSTRDGENPSATELADWKSSPSLTKTPPPSPEQELFPLEPVSEASTKTTITYQDESTREKNGPGSTRMPPLKPEPHDTAQEGEQKRQNPKTIDEIRRAIEKVSAKLLQLLEEACLSEEESPRGRKLERLRRASFNLSGEYFYPSDQRNSGTSTENGSGRSNSAPPTTDSESSASRRSNW
ncbi:hypothetical protein F4774DRAFT_426939 [Daldinia eschscholtzii]|nr:hypothetical protein F4774DRAFT_426939 [Daldinia eschscholtzii]